VAAAARTTARQTVLTVERHAEAAAAVRSSVQGRSQKDDLHASVQIWPLSTRAGVGRQNQREQGFSSK